MTSLEGRELYYQDTGQYSKVLVVSDTSDDEAHRMRLRVTKRIHDGPTVWKEGEEFDIMRRKNFGAWAGSWKLRDSDGNDVITFDPLSAENEMTSRRLREELEKSLEE